MHDDGDSDEPVCLVLPPAGQPACSDDVRWSPGHHNQGRNDNLRGDPMSFPSPLPPLSLSLVSQPSHLPPPQHDDPAEGRAGGRLRLTSGDWERKRRGNSQEEAPPTKLSRGEGGAGGRGEEKREKEKDTKHRWV